MKQFKVIQEINKTELIMKGLYYDFFHKEILFQIAVSQKSVFPNSPAFKSK